MIRAGTLRSIEADRWEGENSVSFLVESCAKVNELFNLFQGGSIVHYVDGRCVSADDHDLSLLGIQW